MRKLYNQDVIAIAHTNMGSMYEARKEYQQAIEHYTEAKKRSGLDFVYPRLGLAGIYNSLGLFDDAQANFKVGSLSSSATLSLTSFISTGGR